MSKAGEEGEVPPQRFDEDDNPLVVEKGSKSGTSRAPILEDLMRKLEKLKAKNKMLRAKGKKTKVYSSSKGDDSSFEEEFSNMGKKGRRKHDKSSYNSMPFNYNNMSSSTTYTSIPIGKVPRFDGTNYNQWKHCMKNYLYSISPKVWKLFVMV
jgi:hypothetical protein